MDATYLKAMEPAARIYCARVGINADTSVPAPHETIAGAKVFQPMWELIAEKMIDLAVMLDAMKEAAAAKAAANDTIITEH